MSSENIILLSIDMFMRFSRIYDNLDYKKHELNHLNEYNQIFQVKFHWEDFRI